MDNQIHVPGYNVDVAVYKHFDQPQKDTGEIVRVYYIAVQLHDLDDMRVVGFKASLSPKFPGTGLYIQVPKGAGPAYAPRVLWSDSMNNSFRTLLWQAIREAVEVYKPLHAEPLQSSNPKDEIVTDDEFDKYDKTGSIDGVRGEGL